MAATTADLQAELERLERELARKKLEEEVMALEMKLQAAKQQQAPPVEGEYEEEIIEEIIEEEIIEDDDDYGEVQHAYTDNIALPQAQEQAPKQKNSVMDRWTNRSNGKTVSSGGKINTGAVGNSSSSAAVDDGCPTIIYSGEEPLPGGPFKRREIPRTPGPSVAGEEGPIEKLIGTTVYAHNKLTRRSTNAVLEGKDLLMLYIGSKWARESKQFYPVLLDFYRTAAEANLMECIYISQDRTLQDFKEIFSIMPFPAMPTETLELKNKLAKDLKLIDTPCVVVLEAATGLVITTHGAQDIAALQRNNVEQANELVATWKCIKPITTDEVVMDMRLKHGKLERQFLYWYS